MMSNVTVGIDKESGYLEMIMGPMYAGKTSRLIDIYNSYQHGPKKYTDNDILVINHSTDTRYNSREIGLCNHDKKFIPCVWANKLFDMVNLHKNIKSNFDNTKFLNVKVILINECQFFSDIVDWVILAVEKYHKKVYICGLDCDFKRNLFGNWLDLIIYANNVIKLKATCKCCNNGQALYSHRLTDSTEQVLIGHSEHEPLCRKCYLNKNMKTT